MSVPKVPIYRHILLLSTSMIGPLVPTITNTEYLNCTICLFICWMLFPSSGKFTPNLVTVFCSSMIEKVLKR